MGSCITYFRRYSLQSFLALQAEDDDANKSSETNNSGKSNIIQLKQKPIEVKPPTKEELISRINTAKEKFIKLEGNPDSYYEYLSSCEINKPEEIKDVMQANEILAGLGKAYVSLANVLKKEK